MTPSRDRAIFGALVIALLITHVWPPHAGEEPMLLGFLPWDLAYHLLWMVGAAGVVLFMTERVWRHEPESPQRSDSD